MSMFKRRLQTEIFIGDGAMGTMLHGLGVPIGVPSEELSLSQPELVRSVHEAYLKAGAQMLETNSFSANRESLARFGLEQLTTKINRAAVRVARQAIEEWQDATTDHQAFVVGSIGAINQGPLKKLTDDEIRALYEEQASALLEEKVDGLLFETFFSLEELLLAIETVRPLIAQSGVPIIGQLALVDVNQTRDGYNLTNALQQLQQAGVDMAGVNCRMGPAEIIRSLELAQIPAGLPVSAFPNAGRPALVDGQFSYASSAAYFGEAAVRLWELGVQLIGGCCGTTPDHVRAMAQALQGKKPLANTPRSQQPLHQAATATRELVVISAAPEASKAAGETKPTVVDLVKTRHTVIVEYDTPRDLNIDKFIQGSRALHEAGADAITMADNSLATTRMSNMALGTILKKELGIEPLVHIACRDRNLLGQQSHLMGLHALDIHQVLVITGDPARVGDLPDSSSVFDVSSFDLIRLIKQLNAGSSFSGKALKTPSRFVVGAAFNPHVRRLDAAVARLEKKIEAGADFIMTQPVYDVQTLHAIRKSTEHIPVPIFIGIMPLTGYRNAEFLHNEVPGIKITDDALQRIKQHEGAAARAEGVAMAQELLDEAVQLFRGIYLITPFSYYEMAATLTAHVKQLSTKFGR